MLRISEICKEKGLTQQLLAKKLGITYQSLHSAISGNPQLETLQSIAKALDVDITELFSSNEKCITCPNCGKKFKMVE